MSFQIYIEHPDEACCQTEALELKTWLKICLLRNILLVFLSARNLSGFVKYRLKGDIFGEFAALNRFKTEFLKLFSIMSTDFIYVINSMKR